MSAMHDGWSFVIAAYAVTALGALAVLGSSWRRMTGAEARVDALLAERDPPA